MSGGSEINSPQNSIRDSFMATGAQGKDKNIQGKNVADVHNLVNPEAVPVSAK